MNFIAQHQNYEKLDVPGNTGTTATLVCFPMPLSKVKARTRKLGKLVPWSLIAVTVIEYIVNGFSSLMIVDLWSAGTVTLIIGKIVRFGKLSWSKVCRVVTFIVYPVTDSAILAGGDHPTSSERSVRGST